MFQCYFSKVFLFF